MTFSEYSMKIDFDMKIDRAKVERRRRRRIFKNARRGKVNRICSELLLEIENCSARSKKAIRERIKQIPQYSLMVL